ncbi:HWE histidine kinase domain-containing protein [Nordella sp. HKS 07]|uniref:HWE histidine kinase domain-containing protein n=1 Tax=Nordella sp. HKS 07 TaxID=2712222 RepID=UPI001FEF0A8F|nr:HWE histidine kinase domain-containing protein [Nordella sp. HKS 07]
MTDEMDAAHALIESEERLRFAVEAGKMAIWEIDLETGVVTITPELNAMFGFPRDYKPSLAELRSRYAPGELEKVGRLGASWEVVKDLVASGQMAPRSIGEMPKDDDRTQVSAELSIIVPPNRTKHLLYRAQYIYSLHGRPKITGFLVDITDKRYAEDQLGVVARELRHRVKNSFTVMQALARQIFNQDIDKRTALESYLGRLQALSLANDIVLDTEVDAANIQEITERLTAPYREVRQDLDCPERAADRDLWPRCHRLEHGPPRVVHQCAQIRRLVSGGGTSFPELGGNRQWRDQS